MKKCFAVTLSFLLLFSLILQGCTTMPNQPFLKKESAVPGPVKINRYVTPDIKVYTNRGLVGSIIVGAVILGVIGAGVTYLIYDTLSIEPSNPDINDFGKLVMDGFMDRSKKEIPNWPTMVIQDKSDEEPLSDQNISYILTIDFGDVKINAESGISVYSIITMKDKEGNIAWQRGYWYDPVDFNRLSTFDDLKANKYKKLNEELAFAADKTVTDFIAHFKNSR